jgi:hypothetical protein
VAIGVEEACWLRTLNGKSEGGELKKRSEVVLTLSMASSTGTGLKLLYCSARLSHTKVIRTSLMGDTGEVGLTLMFVLVHILGTHNDNLPPHLAFVKDVFRCSPDLTTNSGDRSRSRGIPKPKAI